jgi:hypothetical protein
MFVCVTSYLAEFIIRLALIEYAEGGAGMPNKGSEPVRASKVADLAASALQ